MSGSVENKYGVFMDAASKPRCQYKFHGGGEVFHGGGNMWDTRGQQQHAYQATDEQTNRQTEGRCQCIKHFVTELNKLNT